MASAISLEYLQSISGAANGLASLGSAGTIPVAQLPDSVIPPYKGVYADQAALSAAYTSANHGDYAYVTDTASHWYWNPALTTAAWVNQEITAAAYSALTAEQKAAVPYIIVP